jgi:hypothetical protein
MGKRNNKTTEWNGRREERTLRYNTDRLNEKKKEGEVLRKERNHSPLNFNRHFTLVHKQGRCVLRGYWD